MGKENKGGGRFYSLKKNSAQALGEGYINERKVIEDNRGRGKKGEMVINKNLSQTIEREEYGKESNERKVRVKERKVYSLPKKMA